LFRLMFRIRFCRRHFFGLYQKVFKPRALFAGVTKRVKFRKNILLELDLEDWIPQNIYFLNNYEESELRYLEQKLKPGDTFIDAGANIGVFSLVASRAVGPAGKVIGFEPFPRNYEQLVKHAALNSCTNITAVNKSLGAGNGELRLYLNENDKDFGMVSGYAVHHTGSVDTAMTSLDNYLHEHSFSGRITLIKIDVEGGEFPAVSGMMETLKKHRPELLIEVNPGNFHTSRYRLSDLEELLSSIGYKKNFMGLSGEVRDERLARDKSHNYLFRP
jgi:FkbM family methyltransferase